MKYLYLLLILITFNSFSNEDWTHVVSSQNDDFIYFVNNKTIKKDGTQVRFWTKMNNMMENKSVRTLIQIDCKNETYVPLRTTIFSDLNLNGPIQFDTTASPKYIPDFIPPNTINFYLMDHVCKR